MKGSFLNFNLIPYDFMHSQFLRLFQASVFLSSVSKYFKISAKETKSLRMVELFGTFLLEQERLF